MKKEKKGPRKEKRVRKIMKKGSEKDPKRTEQKIQTCKIQFKTFNYYPF